MADPTTNAATSEPLGSRHCRPCHGGTPRLTAAELQACLAQLSPRWQVAPDGTRLVREIVFRDFRRTLAFVQALGELAEAEGHHPDFHVRYNRLTLELYTHAIGGLSENDCILAARIDALVRERRSNEVKGER